MINARLNRRLDWLTPSAYALIAANLVPLAGVVWFQWTVFEIFVLFWAENVVIGVLNVLRMLLSSVDDPVSWGLKLFLVPFFIFHYGMFTFGHGVFVFSLFGVKELGSLGPNQEIARLAELLFSMNLGLPLAALFLSHLFSFFWNFIGRGEYRNANVMVLMFRPYGRIVVLHITLLIGGFILVSLGSPLGGLALLILLKIGFDLRLHRKEHGEKLKPATDKQPTLRELMLLLNEIQRKRRRAMMEAGSNEPHREP